MKNIEYEVKFSPKVIGHMGISMYSTLPPVLAELISNSYDADASNVNIIVDDNKKSIEIMDNGCGMSNIELNDDFLYVGRNRREKKPQITPKYNRYVTGRKGLGKLSVFGICEDVYVESCKDGYINALEFNYDTLLEQEKSGERLIIPAIIKNKITDEKSYTKIILKNLKRKGKLEIDTLANSLMSRLAFFSDDFKCYIKDNTKEIECTREKREKLIYPKSHDIWEIPKCLVDIDEITIKYFNDNNITGRIFATEETLKNELKGIALYARGKLANKAEFYGVKESNTHAYSYIGGTLDVDFIDDNKDIENIATARNSLIWDNDEMDIFRYHLQILVKKIASQWLEKRRKFKKKKIEESEYNFDLTWFDKDEYSSQDKKLAKKITDLVIDSELDEKKSIDLLNYVEGAFEFDTFIEFASDIESNTDASSLIKLMKDWEIIENKEQYRIALGRIETINKFKSLIENDTKEVGGLESMHNFLNTFPWILEPRISTFDDELTYKKMLEEKFDDSTLDIPDRRIDFLCKGFGDTLYLLEIKRSKKIINGNDLKQLEDYHIFLTSNIEENQSDRAKYKHVKSYIIGNKLQDKKETRKKLDILRKSDMDFLEYTIMLGQASEYHKEFIEAYEKTNKLNKF